MVTSSPINGIGALGQSQVHERVAINEIDNVQTIAEEVLASLGLRLEDVLPVDETEAAFWQSIHIFAVANTAHLPATEKSTAIRQLLEPAFAKLAWERSQAVARTAALSSLQQHEHDKHLRLLARLRAGEFADPTRGLPRTA